ncbi:SET domain protein [Dictyocaulus viviparus]|uniref:SET domain protein n=1 Tax=Dictyocaulus viviparus TaxID=29172 RepID=A0A0D8YEC1_DICVI|nr:SET domain protein [Dictyocaulus viviparus]
MNGSSSTRDGHSVVLNDNGFEEEENHDSMDIDSESSSPCQRSESCPSPVFQTCMPSVVDNKKDFVEELLVNGDMKSWIADNVEERRIQQIDDEEQEDLLSNTWKSDIRSPSNPVLECFEVDGMKKTACGTGSLSENANDALMAMVPCTSFSPNLTRDEASFRSRKLHFMKIDDIMDALVDMDVSSGDEADECNHIVDTHETVTLSQIEQKHQTTSEEKKRIEENIQALMKEFERKRFEEKVRRAAEVVSNLLKQRPVSSMVSTTSESPLNDKAELKITPTLVSSPTSVCCTDEDHQQKCESQSMDYEKNDVSCELPSSSIDVPPVPSYEEIEQCIYKVESKKKAVSLMCFCRGNNLDCSDGRCDNRAMFTECPKNCLGKGNDCKNRRFAKREYAAVQAFYTGPSKGFGVQATAPIKKGQFIIEYVGEVVSSEEFAKRLKRYGRDPSHTHHYMFEIGSMIIDATKKGNCSRFMNHSCEPNAVCEKWYVPRTPCAIDRIGFFAKRDIELGEEITFDYQFENYGREAQRCFCGAAACSGWIGKPPELSEDDLLEDGMGSEIEDTEESADEDSKSSGRFLPPCKKTHRYSDNVVVTASEINDRLSKALGIGCRNKTHVLSWIKLMTEMTLIRREERMVQSMHRIVEAISSVDTSLQHIFVANGLPNIFKSWLRTSCPDMITRDDLNLKQCIIRTLLAMQSSAEAINVGDSPLYAHYPLFSI